MDSKLIDFLKTQIEINKNLYKLLGDQSSIPPDQDKKIKELLLLLDRQLKDIES